LVSSCWSAAVDDLALARHHDAEPRHAGDILFDCGPAEAGVARERAQCADTAARLSVEMQIDHCHDNGQLRAGETVFSMTHENLSRELRLVQPPGLPGDIHFANSHWRPQSGGEVLVDY